MNEINVYLKQKNVFFEELLFQIRKDLDLSGIDSEAINNIKNENELIKGMIQLIEELLMYRPDLFHNLLYRIDVNEDHLLSELGSRPQLKLAEIILKREIVKIYFRKKFSP